MPPISRTPAPNFATSFTSVVDTGGKFANGVNDICRVPNNGNNIRLQIPKSELEGKNVSIR